MEKMGISSFLIFSFINTWLISLWVWYAAANIAKPVEVIVRPQINDDIAKAVSERVASDLRGELKANYKPPKRAGKVSK